LIVRCA
jgi:hypothetical protein